MGDIIGGIIIILIVCVIVYLFFKNKKDGKDDYSGMKGGGSINKIPH